MPSFSWRKRATRYFGEKWVPYAEVELRDANEQFQAFAVLIDSGAVVSLLRRSAAELLGIQLDAGRRIDLSGVGGATTYAYVHDLAARFEGLGVLTVPFAIAEQEDVPNLLGRHAVFDVCQVDFDCTLRETRLTAGWLNENQVKIWRFMLETDQYIIKRWSDKALPGRGDEAAQRFIRRGGQVMAAIAGLLKLDRSFECPSLIRSLLELAMQLEYLLRDPAARAEAYFDYEHVAQYKQAQALVIQPEGSIARFLAQSPQRPAGEARLRQEYDRVRSRFLRTPGSGIWDKWYCMKVHDLAQAVGRLPEYRLWYRMCSGWAHGDPFHTRANQLFDERAAFMLAMCYYGRMLLRIADAKAIILTGEQHDMLKTCETGLI